MTAAAPSLRTRAARVMLRGMRRSLWVVLALALGGWQPFRTTDPDVEAGNRAFADGRYDDALAAYDRAAGRGGVDPDGLAFDRGTAELKKADQAKDATEKQRLTERALDDLKQATRAKDPHIRGAASYNRGNSLLDQGKLAEAIESYKQALRDDPELDDARLNLELALRRRQKQPPKDQQGQGQRGQGQGQGQQGQNQQGQNQQGQGQPGQGQNQQGQGQQGQGSQDGANGQGQNQPPDANGQNQQSGSGGSADPQNGSNGAGSNGPRRPDRSNDADGNGAPGQGQQPSGRPQRSRGAPRSPRTPPTPIDGKLDDLDGLSRQLQKSQSRRRATGHPSDPQRDW